MNANMEHGTLQSLNTFLSFSVSSDIVQDDAKTSINFVDNANEFLPEKGPFVFFDHRPVAIIHSDHGDVILSTMIVTPEFCTGHFNVNSKFEPRPALPLYFVGGAAGQLCAIYTTIMSNDERFVALATEGSAVSLGSDLIDVRSILLFVVRVVDVKKRGFDFEYEVLYAENKKVAKGTVKSMSVPKPAIFRKLR